MSIFSLARICWLKKRSAFVLKIRCDGRLFIVERSICFKMKSTLNL